MGWTRQGQLGGRTRRLFATQSWYGSKGNHRYSKTKMTEHTHVAATIAGAVANMDVYPRSSIKSITARSGK